MNHPIIVTMIGAAVGFISGLFGKGGSAVTTPILNVFLAVPSYYALASPLPVTLPTTLSAAWAYRRHGMIHRRVVWITCLWGIPATVLGSWMSQWTGGHFLMELTAVFVGFLGIMMLWESNSLPPDGAVVSGRAADFKLAAIALSVGFLSGLLANTGGILYTPLFIWIVRLPPKQAMASSLLVAAILAIPGTVMHWYLGHIDWWLVAALSIGCIPCSYLGARLAIYLRTTTLVKIYGLSLALFGLYDFFHVYHVHG